MIIVDSNEAVESHHLVESLNEVVGVSIKPLEAGDYLIVGSAGQALIERKTIFDFLNSLKDRLWDQLEKLKEFEGEKSILLEGYLGLYRRRGWKEVSVLALMDRIIHGWGIPIIYTPDVMGTLTYLVWKHKALGKAEEFREYPLRVRRKEMNLEEQAIYTLEGLCGHETAKALLRHFKTLRDTISFFDERNVTLDEGLKDVKVGGRRIPSTTVKRMVQVINYVFEK
ncbi:MAG: ERCC4 domain-containing protein [Candidatus Caldarchaeum sp.]